MAATYETERPGSCTSQQNRLFTSLSELTLCVRCMERLFLVVSLVPCVQSLTGAPVEGTTRHIIAAHSVGVVIASGFHDVNFARVGPFTIRVVHGHHPDCWPEPVSLWKLSFNLNPAVLDGDTLLRIQTCRPCWGHDSAIGGVRHCVAILPGSSYAALLGQVDDSVLVD